MKRAVIVHCWGGYPEYCWYQSVKQDLEAQGFSVEVPAFPDTEAPSLKKWLPVLTEVAGTPDEDLYLIGHSIGSVTVLRYLETLGDAQKVGGVVLVAGFTDDLSHVDPIEDELSNFFETPIRWEYIKSKANKFVAIHSDDDPYVSLDYGEIFKEKLDAELIIKHGMKHFSGPVDEEESCTELPDVVEQVVSNTK